MLIFVIDMLGQGRLDYFSHIINSYVRLPNVRLD
jgi:hypothetical protein